MNTYYYYYSGRPMQNSPTAYSGSVASASTSSSIPPSPSVMTVSTFNTSNFTSVRLNQSETDNNLVASFTHTYERHCKEIFLFISTNQVEKVGECMNTFYNNMPEEFVRLIQTKPEITEAVWRWDCLLYDVSFTSIFISTYCINIYF